MKNRNETVLQKFAIIAAYKFIDLPNCVALKEEIHAMLSKRNIVGTILLGAEGINGTIAGRLENINEVMDNFHDYPEFASLEFKISYANKMPFHRLKVKIKNEIVTCGDDAIRPHKKTGEHVDINTWNHLLDSSDVYVLDTRNKYEIELGTFEGAQHLNLDNFRDFKDKISEIDIKKNSKIAMFCTGGIRCEKASAIMIEQGFLEVYQLNGGILKYLEEVPKEQSKWNGECFVFDNRVSVDSDLQPGNYDLCHACRNPLSDKDKSSKAYKPHIFCPHCINMPEHKKARAKERQKQMDLAKARGEVHLGREY